MGKKILKYTALGALVLLLLIASSIYVFTGTDWGRDRIRVLAISQLNKVFNGEMQIGAISGDLLSDIKLTKVAIVDSNGTTFLSADTIRTDYSLRNLFSKKIILNNVKLVNPIVLLDKRPGERWNYERIFRLDTLPGEESAPGFGSWIVLHNVTLINGSISTRIPWEPDSDLDSAQRDSVIQLALAPESRQQIERVEGGFQNVSQFKEISGNFPYLRIADPVNKGQVFDANGLSLIAQPFRPPAVRILSVTGRFTILDDSLYFTDAGIRLTDSRLVGSGAYNLSNDDLRLRIHANPVATNDLLWIDPNIPRDGQGALHFALDWVGNKNSYVATDIDFAVAGAKINGDLGIVLNADTMGFQNTSLNFSRVDTRTLEQLFPTLKSPVHGYLTGAADVEGTLDLMRLNTRITFSDPESGDSRLRASGHIGMPGNNIVANRLNLALETIQVGLANHFMEEPLPMGGYISGVAELNGNTGTRLNVQTDIVHHDTENGNSRVTGTVAYGGGREPLLNADLYLQPLSLLTVGRFAPVAELRGTLAGPVQLTGPLHALLLNASLSTPDGGSLNVTGTGSFSDSLKRYNIQTVASLFDASVVSGRSPTTSISAALSLKGEGIEPETMNASLNANFRASVYDSVNVDSASISLRAREGLLTVDTFQVRLPHARADLSGTFGLADSTEGTLNYAVQIDSLGVLSRFIPRDTGEVVIRPAVNARILEQARADSARIHRETEVEREVTGAPPPVLVADTISPIRKEELSGVFVARGTASGNIHSIGIDGDAQGSDIIALGSSIKLLTAKYRAANIMTATPDFEASILASDVLASGFAIDTLTAGITHQNPDGVISIRMVQPDSAIYALSSSYSLLDGTKSIFIDNTNLRFDSATFVSDKAAILSLDSTGINIDAIELLGPNNSRIFADALIPKKGDAILHVSVENFDIANIMSLTQTDTEAQGLLTFDITAEGTVGSPSLVATFSGKNIAYNAMPVPQLEGSLEYQSETLQTHILARQSSGRTILQADGTIPVNLALTEIKGSRIPKDREIDLKVIADSLPLDIIPEIEDVVSNLYGIAVAEFEVGGRLDQVDARGFMSLDNGRMTLLANGVTYSRMNGMIRLLRDTVIVDSLYAESNGFVRASGGIGIKNLREPSFNLELTASNLQVLNNDLGRIHADAELAMSGPFSGVTVNGIARVKEGYVYVSETGGKTLIGADDPTLYQILDTTLAKNRALFPTTSPFAANLEVNVSLGVNRDFFVRTKDAHVELYTEDDLLVTLAQNQNLLRLDGMLLSDRGEYRFQGKRFAVKRGTALFANTTELDPSLQITAEYEVQFASREAIAIQILIGGTLTAPQITLTSDAQPPISQTDLLSYLAFGQSSSSLMQVGGNGLTTGGSGGSNIVGQGAAFATKQVTAAALGAVTDEIAGEAARSLGADVLTIAPAPVSLDAASVLRGTEIQFGKYLQNRTFLSLQLRPDPQSLKRPGFHILHLFDVEKGYKAEISFEPRYLPREASLARDRIPITTSVFGVFLIREWRF